VLADLLWHVQERFKPKFMVDLATLTGAILVALAQEHAGLFSNTTSFPSASPPRASPPAKKSGGCRSGPNTTR
jgi:hypothetical protein